MPHGAIWETRPEPPAAPGPTTAPAPALPDPLLEVRRRAQDNPVIYRALACLPANPTPADIIATLSAIIAILDTERTDLYTRLARAMARQPVTYVLNSY